MRELRAEYADHEGEAATFAGDRAVELAANVTVTDPPFADEPILGHIDTTGPTLLLEEGHLDDSDFGIEMPWTLARQLFVDRDPAQVMPALLGGSIKLTGDSSKVLALAAVLAPPPGTNDLNDPSGPAGTDGAADAAAGAPSIVRELIRRIDEITET